MVGLGEGLIEGKVFFKQFLDILDVSLLSRL